MTSKEGEAEQYLGLIGPNRNILINTDWYKKEIAIFLAGVQWRDSTLPALLQKAYIMGFGDGTEGTLRAPLWSEFLEEWE